MTASEVHIFNYTGGADEQKKRKIVKVLRLYASYITFMLKMPDIHLLLFEPRYQMMNVLNHKII